MLLVINYHYIRSDCSFPYPGIHPISPEELEFQLSELAKHFEFINLSILEDLICESTCRPKPLCLITFDDGLREQYELAVPVLRKLNIPAVFFINTLPLREKRTLTVHKIHWLRATRPPDVFLKQFLEILSNMGLKIDINTIDEKVSSQQYLYDDLETKKVKYLINHVVPYDVCDIAINELFHKEKNELEFCESLYMSKDQILEISEEYEIGSHSDAHRPLTSLNSYELQRDLSISKDTLEEITGKHISAISYPYGGPTAVSHDVAKVAYKIGYRVGFTTERSPNRTLQYPLLLSRLSTNDALGGTSSCMLFEEHDLKFSYPVLNERSVYFDEFVSMEEMNE